MSFVNLLYGVSTINKAWRAGHRQKIQQDDISLSEMCEDLNECVTRIPQKISSVLVNGAALTYSAGLDDLYKDVIKLNKEIITRNKRKPSADKDKQSKISPTRSGTKRRAGQSVLETSEEIDKDVLSSRLKSKRSRSDIKQSETSNLKVKSEKQTPDFVAEGSVSSDRKPTFA